MNRRRAAAGMVVLAALALGLGVWLWRARSREAAADRLVLYGNVDIRQVQLAFNGSERIDRMLVEEGDRVEKGQLVAVLDKRRLQHAADRAAAEVRAQREVLARLEAGSRPEEIRKARAEAEAAAAEAQNARLLYARRKPLAAKDVVSKEQADDARAAAEAAQARLQAAKEALDLAIEGPRREDIAAAKATLQANEAALALAQRELADTELYAPAAGVIRDRLLEPGDMASPQRPVYTLALTAPLWVRTYVPETDLGKIHPGMSASVSSDSFPDKQYRAWIGFISPTAEFTPKSVETTEIRTSLVYQVRVHVCAPQGELRLGMPATVTVPLNQPAAAPNAADRCASP